MPSNVFVTVTAAAPAWCALVAISTMSVTCAVSFAHTGRSASATTALDRVRGVVDVVREEVRASVEVRTTQVQLDRDDVVRRACELRGCLPVLLDRSSPDADHDTRARALQRGQVVREPRVDARTLEADAVQHASPSSRAVAARGCRPTAPPRATSRRRHRAAAAGSTPRARHRAHSSPTPSSPDSATRHRRSPFWRQPLRYFAVVDARTRGAVTGRAPVGRRSRRGGTPAASGRGARGAPSRRCLRPRRVRPPRW